jgi:hypothetical protein
VRVDTCESKGVQLLTFNVRGFGMRWHEVLLLVDKYDVDVAIPLETVDADLKVCRQLFSDFSLFFLKGENKNGRMLILVSTDLYASRIKYDLTNVCTVEFQGKAPSRILGIYAPKSRSWPWEHLSQYMSRSNVLFVDFNVNLECDQDKALRLLIWAIELAPSNASVTRCLATAVLIVVITFLSAMFKVTSPKIGIAAPLADK